MEKFDVAVLMSTYNGEVYLKEQIESILQQSDVTVRLYVRDDGSNDGTMSLLREYEAEGKIRLLDIPGNLGPGVSFMELLYAVPGHMYYAFADQDDIWKTEKLIMGIRALEDQASRIPALYCSNQMLYVDGKEMHMRFDTPPAHTLVSCICGNYVSGCTMVFNRELRDIVAAGRADKAIIKSRLHDAWMITVALVSGKVIYDQDSYIDYRIHSNNTVGLKTGRFKRIIKKLKSSESRNGRSRLCQELQKHIPIADSVQKEIVSCFADCNNSIQNKLRLLKNRNIKRDCIENSFVFCLKTLLGWQ